MTVIDEIVTPAPQEAAPPEPAGGVYAWYMVGLLMLIYTSSFIDRTVIALLVKPIRADLGISDTQMSLLSGISFAILYTTLGIPFGRLADRHSRRVIISLGAITWSVMTAACGLAQGFAQLFMARVGVGVGEAALTPAAYSLIGDSFPRAKLAKALGIYNVGISLGSGLALLLGGIVIGAVSKAAPVVLPVVGALKPWQTTFLVVSIPGALLGLILLATVREPARRGVVLDSSGQVSRPSLGGVIAYLWGHKRVYLPLYAGYSLYALVNFGFAAWIPTCLIRSFGWTAAETGQRYGLAVLILGTLGAVSGGLLADRMLRGGDKAAYIKVAIFSGLGVLPFSVLAPLAPDAALSLALFAGAILCNSTWLAVCGGSIQLVAPNQMRGQATALMFLFSSMIGFGLGPTAIALITDKVFGYDEAIKYSLAIVAAVAMPLGLIIFKMGQKAFAAEVVAMEAGGVRG